ncbi:MAG: redoxin domain-containing protein [Ignavibacteria bacterium]|nr:redoxin domain-containing protein [Ignavibacteria bacterium]
MLKIGDLAPDFTLKSKNLTGEIVDISLHNYKGKNVVLLFFPLAFTGVCTEEMCSVSQGLDFYSNLNADVLAISVDSVFTQEEWAKKNQLKIPVLSDFNREVIEKYGCDYKDFLWMKGVAKRSAFVIDKEGKIQYMEILEDAGKLPDFGKIQNCIKSLA